jgi:hypothetical protein
MVHSSHTLICEAHLSFMVVAAIADRTFLALRVARLAHSLGKVNQSVVIFSAQVELREFADS